MSVFIISTHIAGRYCDNWIKLQNRFVNESVGEYEYGVIVNNDDVIKYNNIVYSTDKLLSHTECINIALKLFKDSNHSHFLLLDNDCWPIRKNWIELLNNMLSDRYLYAAPVRIENFDTFPHPCAFYMRREFLENVNFSHTKVLNALGIVVSDVGSGMPQFLNDKQIWLPLLKSNYISPHPVYASVYSDLFYHHCAGSRGIGFRSFKYGFYNHIIDNKSHSKIYNVVTDNLIANPRKFINSLRGVGVERGCIV